MEQLIREKVNQSMSYEEYRTLMGNLVAEGKTTGPNQSESMANYTKMNEHRMKRLDKTFKISEELEGIVAAYDKDYIWLVITEAWCGDAAQTVPILQKVAAGSDKIELRVVLRDEHPDLMEKFLTDGAKSIPKLIIIDKERMQVEQDWGPRPAPAQDMLMEFKANPDLSYSEFSLSLQKWYNQDKGETTQSELIQTLKSPAQLYI
ncbi:MAG: thioredoxin family protein [Bacteroidota bacterium]